MAFDGLVHAASVQGKWHALLVTPVGRSCCRFVVHHVSEIHLETNFAPTDCWWRPRMTVCGFWRMA